MLNSMDLLAKLLANENITVVRAPVKTASFDIVRRQLTLPQWKEMSPAVEEMLMGHEVGHALYTTNDYIRKDESRLLQTYMNVVEDVRIEKKIKNKYPGLRAAFTKAYKELADKDFFDIQNRDINKMLLIDRINLFYKIGYNCGARFSKVEQEFLTKIDRCDTIQDVYNVAKELLEFTREEVEKKRKEMQDSQDGEEGDGMDASLDYDDVLASDEDSDIMEQFEDDQNSSGDGGKKSIGGGSEPTEEDSELESHTDKALQRKLQDLADQSITTFNIEVKIETDNRTIVPYKEVYASMDECYQKMVTQAQTYHNDYYVRLLPNEEEFQSYYTKFMQDSDRVVSYLIKEFEMKKSANRMLRAQTSKSGEIDVRKLFAYKIKNDLFKRVTIVPDAKNHGMVFLLDWSGSMANAINDTVKQVINLAMFCHKAQIPYQVFAFSDSYIKYDDAATIPGAYVQSGALTNDLRMLELFSSKMKKHEFNDMVECMMRKPWQWSRRMTLGGTPLNESLLFLADYLDTFIKANSVEKVSLITLTDGEGTALEVRHNGAKILGGSYYSRGNTIRMNFIDPRTKRQYQMPFQGTQQTKVLLRILKDRYNLVNIGFHVLYMNKREIYNFVRVIYNLDPCNELYEHCDSIRKQVRDNDFAALSNTGFDELYLLSTTKLKTEEGDLQVTKDMNSKQVHKQLLKYLDRKVTSRVLLSRFIKMVA